MKQEPESGKPYSERQRFEAAGWFLDIYDSEDPSPELLRRWSQWFEASEGNRRAFLAIERAWLDVPVTPAGTHQCISSGADQNYDGSLSVVEWLERKGHGDKWSARMLPRGKYGQFGAWAAAAATVLIAGWWSLQPQMFARHPSSGEFATTTGEHMELVLADGSSVTLGARSSLAVDFHRHRRDVRLTGGEAFFSIARDPARPFRVHVQNGLITAVGTAFNVRMTGDRVTVAVTEGIVSVSETNASLPRDEGQASSGSSGRSSAIRLSSGEQITFHARLSPAQLARSAIARVDVSEPPRWRDGWLVYRDEPLRYVITDVARYADREISVDESVDDSLRFTGAVFKGSVIEWIDALPEVFPVAVDSTDGATRVVAPAAAVTASP